MPKLTTPYFNELEYSNQDVFDFPAGLPGFEDQIAFLYIHQEHTRPLVFMQSLLNPSLCFLALPVLVVESDYRLALSAEELAALELPAGATPKIGRDVACFVLVTLTEESSPTVNLMSPVVLNLHTRKAIQAVPAASDYSLRHPLPLAQEPVPCS